LISQAQEAYFVVVSSSVLLVRDDDDRPFVFKGVFPDNPVFPSGKVAGKKEAEIISSRP
jgi:hypothetical protein